MKKQGFHMLMQMLTIVVWLAVYTVFVDKLFGVEINIYSAMAYLLMIYLFVLKKIGSNINRRYEIYVEIFGRLSAVNGVWLLFLWALTTEREDMVWDIIFMLLLALIESVVFAAIFLFDRRMTKQIHGEKICFISREDAAKQAKEKVRQNDMVFLNDLPSEQRNELLKYCYEQGKQVYCTTKLSDVIIRGSGLTQYNDSPVLFCAKFGYGMGYRIVKRILDIVWSLVFLVVLSPVFLIIACKIKLEDGGTVFYHQTRCTENEKEFQIYKFRSMIMNAEEENGAKLAEENDCRLTRIGGVIRKTKLDELPQLLNILKGEMSFVGPRPERPEFIEAAKKEIPEFVLRTKVKAGLTGYAQVMGNYNTDFLDKLKWDLMYIENHSLFLDAKILLMTVWVVFRKK